MIRVVLAQKGILICRALAQLLANEDDLHVVAELGACDEVLPAAIRERPHVAIIDYTLPGSPVIQVLCTELCQKVPDCRILMILDRSMPSLPGAALARMAPKVGLLATDASPFQLVDSVRRLARGQAVLDVDIAVAALSATTNPLTRREQQVLLLVTEGTPTKEVAARLFLTDGTVRNHLSRITAKIGARTLIEAVKRAQEAGWV